MQMRRLSTLVLLVAFGLDIGAVATMVIYANGMTRCWSLQQSGLVIGCGPQVPIWAWAGTVVIGLALVTVLLRQRRTSTR